MFNIWVCDHLFDVFFPYDSNPHVVCYLRLCVHTKVKYHTSNARVVYLILFFDCVFFIIFDAFFFYVCILSSFWNSEKIKP